MPPGPGQAWLGPALPQSHINQGCATAAVGPEPGLGGREQPVASSSQGDWAIRTRVLGPQGARPEQALVSTARPGEGSGIGEGFSMDREGEMVWAQDSWTVNSTLFSLSLLHSQGHAPPQSAF